jgi:hypothetical protein
MPAEWLVQIEGWWGAQFLRTSLYAYPLVNATHIFGIALLIGSIIPADLRLLGAFQRVPIPIFVTTLTGFSAAGLFIAIVSGFLLFSVNPQEYLENNAFLIKVALVGIGAANAGALRLTPAWRTVGAGGDVGVVVRVSALLSLVLWPAALVSGRWIGFL